MWLVLFSVWKLIVPCCQLMTLNRRRMPKTKQNKTKNQNLSERGSRCSIYLPWPSFTSLTSVDMLESSLIFLSGGVFVVGSCVWLSCVLLAPFHLSSVGYKEGLCQTGGISTLVLILFASVVIGARFTLEPVLCPSFYFLLWNCNFLDSFGA